MATDERLPHNCDQNGMLTERERTSPFSRKGQTHSTLQNENNPQIEDVLDSTPSKVCENYSHKNVNLHTNISDKTKIVSRDGALLHQLGTQQKKPSKRWTSQMVSSHQEKCITPPGSEKKCENFWYPWISFQTNPVPSADGLLHANIGLFFNARI